MKILQKLIEYLVSSHYQRVLIDVIDKDGKVVDKVIGRVPKPSIFARFVR